MKKYLLTILILTILASGLVVSGCQILKPVQNNNASANADINVIPDPSSVIPAEAGIQEQNTDTSTTTEEVDTSDWKTYRNEEYGFEFKYPKELVIRKIEDRISIGRKDEDVYGEAQKLGYKYLGDVFLKVFVNNTHLSARDYYSEFNGNIFFNENTFLQLKLNNHDVYKFIAVPGFVKTNIYIIPIDNLLIEVTEIDHSYYLEGVISSLNKLK